MGIGSWLPALAQLLTTSEKPVGLSSIQLAGNGVEIRADFILLFGDRLEKDHSSGELDVDERRLPLTGRNLYASEFHGATFVDMAEYSVTELNVVYQFT